MKIRVIIVSVIVLLIGSGVAIVVLMQSPDGSQTATGAAEQDPAAGFVPRRTRAEIEKGIAAARSQREKLAPSSANDVLDAEAQKAREVQNRLLAAQTPSGAETEARTRLAEIEQKIVSTSDPKEREQLERQKRLVEEVLAKLGKM